MHCLDHSCNAAKVSRYLELVCWDLSMRTRLLVEHSTCLSRKDMSISQSSVTPGQTIDQDHGYSTILFDFFSFVDSSNVASHLAKNNLASNINILQCFTKFCRCIATRASIDDRQWLWMEVLRLECGLSMKLLNVSERHCCPNVPINSTCSNS
ncbi:hypothetical protein LINPERPRIM_LOCUS35914 [Linum perenne]